MFVGFKIVEVRDLIWNCFIGLCFALQRRIWVEEKSWEPPIYYYYYLKKFPMYSPQTQQRKSLRAFFFSSILFFVYYFFYFFVKRRKYKREEKKPLKQSRKMYVTNTKKKYLNKNLRNVSSNKCAHLGVWFKSKSKKNLKWCRHKIMNDVLFEAQTSSETFFLLSFILFCL